MRRNDLGAIAAMAAASLGVDGIFDGYSEPIYHRPRKTKRKKPDAVMKRRKANKRAAKQRKAKP